MISGLCPDVSEIFMPSMTGCHIFLSFRPKL